MEKLTYLLGTYEVKLGLHLILYIILLVVGADIVRYLRRKRPPADAQGSPTPAVPTRGAIRKILAVAGLPLYLLVFILAIRSMLLVLTPVAHVRTVVPQANGNTLRYDEPIQVEFDVPVDTRNLRVNVNPKTDFVIRHYPAIPGVPYARFFTFTPKLSYTPGEKIMVYLSNSKNPLSHDFGSEYLLEYQTGKAPSIVETIPGRDSADVPADTEIVVKLTGSDTPQNIWEAEVTPPEEHTVLRTKEQNFKIHFSQPLDQNTRYAVAIYRTPATVDLKSGTSLPTGEKSKVWETAFVTAKAPLVASFQPTGEAVIPKTPLEVLFDGAMQADSVKSHFSLNPEVPDLEFTWSEKNTKLTIAHPDFAKDTLYTARFGKGTSSETGGLLEKDVTFAFRSVGKVIVSDPSPANTQTATPGSAIRIPFNQEVDQADAQGKFSVTPPVPGKFSWDKTTMIFKPDANLKSGTGYTYRIDRGIKSIYGYPSDQVFEYKFTTGPSEFALSVPFYYQEELFTCNIAAARQLLAFRGVYLSEQQLKAEIGSRGTRGDGDPNKTHVPNYGTYWDPVYRGVSQHRPARVYKNWNLTDLLREVEKGNPVMIWGQNGWSDPHEISWTNPDGTFIYAINGMHSAVVRGWRGPLENPIQILINDPWRGVYAIATGEFMRRWNFFKVAMVVD